MCIPPDPLGLSEYDGMIRSELYAVIADLKHQLEEYAAEEYDMRSAGFENAQDLFTSYLGIKQKLEEAKYEISNKNERIEFLEQMRDAAIHDNNLRNNSIEMWKQQSDNHLLHLCEMVTENESLKQQLAAIKDKND